MLRNHYKTAEISIPKTESEHMFWFFKDQGEDELHKCVTKKDGVVDNIKCQ